MSAKKSHVWAFFDVEDGEAFCTASPDCRSRFVLGAAGANQQANLKRHLKRKHAKAFAKVSFLKDRESVVVFLTIDYILLRH